LKELFNDKQFAASSMALINQAMVYAWAQVRDCDAAIRRARIEGTATMITGIIGASIGVAMDNIPACLIGLACFIDAMISLTTWRRLLVLREQLEWEAELRGAWVHLHRAYVEGTN